MQFLCPFTKGINEKECGRRSKMGEGHFSFSPFSYMYNTCFLYAPACNSLFGLGGQYRPGGYLFMWNTMLVATIYDNTGGEMPKSSATVGRVVIRPKVHIRQCCDEKEFSLASFQIQSIKPIIASPSQR